MATAAGGVSTGFREEAGEGDLRGLRIKHAVVKRTLKEFDCYIKEEQQQMETVEKMRAEESDQLRQREGCLSETRLMIPDTEKRLKAASVELLSVIQRDFGSQLKTLHSSQKVFFSTGQSNQASAYSVSALNGSVEAPVNNSSTTASSVDLEDPLLKEVKESVISLNLIRERFLYWRLEDITATDSREDQRVEEEEEI